MKYSIIKGCLYTGWQFYCVDFHVHFTHTYGNCTRTKIQGLILVQSYSNLPLIQNGRKTGSQYVLLIVGVGFETYLEI